MTYRVSGEPDQQAASAIVKHAIESGDYWVVVHLFPSDETRALAGQIKDTYYGVHHGVGIPTYRAIAMDDAAGEMVPGVEIFAISEMSVEQLRAITRQHQDVLARRYDNDEPLEPSGEIKVLILGLQLPGRDWERQYVQFTNWVDAPIQTSPN